MPQTTTLDNGLRVVTEAMPQMQSVTLGLFCATGSRYEAPAANGISHFLEHMFFKGSAKRPDPLLIARAIEGIGGHFNGYTHQEATAFYAVTLAEHFPIALDVISDMILHPVMDPEALSRERVVVIQEIRTAKDVPQSWVHELLQEEMYREQALGRPIAGTEEVVGALDAPGCLAYRADWYHPKNLVLSVAGRIEHEHVVEQAAQAMAAEASGRVAEYEPAQSDQTELRVKHEQRDCEEVHLCLGFRGLPRRHPDEYAVRVLDTIMGSGMSSRLFQEIREKRGLAYSVGAYPRFWQDAGAWTVYGSVERAKVDEAMTALIEQLHRISNERVDETEFNEAKQFIKGSVLLGLESTQSFAMMLGERMLHSGTTTTAAEIGAKIDAVTAEAVQRVAGEIITRQRATLAVVGPVTEEEFGKLAERVHI